MMRRALLDTDILSEYLKNRDPNVMAQGDLYAQTYGQFEVTSVTVHEVLYGLKAKGASAQAARFLAWIGRNVGHSPTSEDYRLAAEARGEARAQGKALEISDCLIAAAASRLDRVLVSGNTAHYEAIQAAGLSIELLNWRLPSPKVS